MVKLFTTGYVDNYPGVKTIRNLGPGGTSTGGTSTGGTSTRATSAEDFLNNLGGL